MLEIKGDTIHMTRGLDLDITLNMTNYTFEPGEIVVMEIYDEASLEKDPLKTITALTDDYAKEAVIHFKPEDTASLVKIYNSPEIYWYQIRTDMNRFIKGYDISGPKKLILYPKGVSTLVREE